VTGGAGFIGSHLARELLSQGHEVIIIDDLSVPKTDGNIPKGSVFIEKSLEKIDSNIFRGVDVVFHLAAISGEAISFYAPRACYLRNIEAGYNLIKCSIEAKIKRIVYTSSMAVYGNQILPPFLEDSAGDPTDPYGVAKLSIEKLLQAYGRVDCFEWNIIRPHNVYGPNMNLRDPYRGVAAIFITHAFQNKAIPLYGDGTQTRAFTFVEDIIPGIIRSGLDVDIKSQTLNLGSRRPVRLVDLANVICEIIGSEKKHNFLPERKGEAKHAFTSSDLAEKILGFVDKTSLREGLEQTIVWAKKQKLEKFDFSILDFDLDLGGSPIPWAKQK
jgi:UDP-glucose 4-epimerase